MHSGHSVGQRASRGEKSRSMAVVRRVADCREGFVAFTTKASRGLCFSHEEVISEVQLGSLIPTPFLESTSQ